MVISVRAVQSISLGGEVFPQTLSIKLYLGVSKENRTRFWKYVKIKLSELSTFEVANCPFLYLLRHRKFQKWTSLLFLSNCTQQKNVCISKLCVTREGWKACQFWYVFIWRFAKTYLKHPLVFLKLVKSTLSFLVDIFKVRNWPLKTPVDLLYWDVREHRNIKSSCTYYLPLPWWLRTFGDFASVTSELCKLFFWENSYRIELIA